MIRATMASTTLAFGLTAVLAACAVQQAAPLRHGMGIAGGVDVGFLGPVQRLPAAPLASAAEARAADPDVYVVQPGEGLYTLARRFGVPAARLIEANGLDKPYSLLAGQRLRLPPGVDGRPGTAPPPAVVPPAAVLASLPASGKAAAARHHAAQPARQPELGAGAARLPERTAAVSPPPVPSSVETAETAVQTMPLPSIEVPAVEPRGLAATPADAAPAPTAVAEAAKAVESQRADEPAMPRGNGRFLWPVSGELLSRFGSKPGGLFNDGINIRVKPGQPVLAADAGVVAYAGNELKGFGNLLLIRHADGWVSAYAHNQTLQVKTGERVKRGQAIALAGDSGNVGTPQLHFELRRGSVPVDPIPHLGGGEPTRSALRAARPGPG